MRLEEKIIAAALLTPRVSEAVAKYSLLERRIGSFISKTMADACGQCQTRCCKIDFCSESISSPWLRMVWTSAGQSVGNYDGSNGWLSPLGCKLTVGRPPICHEFYCSSIMRRFRDDPVRDELLSFSNSINVTGRNALGKRHLVTLTLSEILEKVNLEKLIEKIDSNLAGVSIEG